MDTFSEFTKNVAPHEIIVKANRIEGRAPGKASKKPSTIEEKRYENRPGKTIDFSLICSLILGGFWKHFRVPKPFENQCRFQVVCFCDYGAATPVRRARYWPSGPPGRRPYRAKRET